MKVASHDRSQFTLRVIVGAPSFYDPDALARQLHDIRTTAFIRILMDQGIYVGMMSVLIRHGATRPASASQES